MEASTVQNQEQHKPTTVCPCCGAVSDKTEVKVSDQVMDHFLACLYTGQAFWRDYRIYNDKVRVRVTIPDQNKTSLLLYVLKKLIAKPQDSGISEQQITQLQLGLRCMLAITEVEISSPNPQSSLASITRPGDTCLQLLECCKRALDTGATTDVAEWCEKLLFTLQDPGQCTAIPLGVLVSIYHVHKTVYNTIIGAGFGKNFWQGIELT